MKRYLSLALAAAAAVSLSATTPPGGNHLEVSEVAHVDARTAHFDYVPGQLIVKFSGSGSARINAPRRTAFRSSGSTAVDRAFRTLGVQEVEELMPLSGAATFRQAARAYNGATVAAEPMDRVYRITLADGADLYQAAAALAQLPEIEYAEPNFRVYALEDVAEPDDPYYSLQYGIADINLPDLWGKPVLSKKGPVIAIIDTGVDTNHPDLVENLWINEAEAAGAGTYDDDSNGYTDDICGWDFVNNTGIVADYNGHGTHCAGIAAASGYNGLGIIGANPHASIMPLTAMQSTGQGDIATIIRAIDYATANGADIISMSLGTYSESAALRQALGRAYQTAVIVAAAGNDGYCLNHKHPEKAQMAPMPMFPAAYNFVLGVQASGPDGGITSFSNYDDNGAAFSEYPEDQLYNYEITAPGASIISTYPGGQYRRLNGTSMATPLVAGAVSRLLQAKEYTSKEELFGDLINAVTPKGNLDIAAAYSTSEADRRPSLQLVTYRLDDADGDGNPDAGEMVAIYPKFRNLWGNARNISYKIELAELEDRNIIEFDADGNSVEMNLSLSAYATAEATQPVRFTVNPAAVDGRQVRLHLTATCDNITEPVETELVLTVENGVEIGGVIGEDMTLTADKNYIVTHTLAIPEGVTLTIEPGTHLKFRPGAGLKVEDGQYEQTATTNPKNPNFNHFINSFPNAGKIIAKGEPGRMIVFDGMSQYYGYTVDLDFGSCSQLEYCHFTEFKSNEGIYIRLTNAYYPDESDLSFIDWSIVSSGNGYAKHCIVDEIYAQVLSFGSLYASFPSASLLNCNFINSAYGTATENISAKYSNYINLNNTESFQFVLPDISGSGVNNSKNVFNNTVILNGESVWGVRFYENNVRICKPWHSSYFGTGCIDLAKNMVWDINKGVGNSELDMTNMLTRPLAEAHGIVWKVVVNGYDAQDEFDLLPPLGVGRHKFEVYFNRPMDTTVAPTIAMGVRAPYTQTAIAEDGSWNEAGDVYTAYLTISGRSDYDGLNRIYVADARDTDFFPIPYENVRFNVLVQAAGSLSEGFTAEAGLGRVNLTWDNSEENFDDMLGYNMYRYTVDDAGTPSDTVRINSRVLESTQTELTDYEVIPGTTYCYYYKVLRTSLTENAPSKTVAVTPLTSEAGDANGSGNVDVADVITAVNYAAGMEPRPFIFEAADMNADSEIDILDVVGIIRTIRGGASSLGFGDADKATYYVDDEGTVYLHSPVALAGIQLNLNAGDGATVTPAAALAGFELLNTPVSRDDFNYLFMAYSLNGHTLAPGLHAVAHIGNAELCQVLLSDVSGTNVDAVYGSDMSGVDNVIVAEPAATGIYNIMGIKVADDASALSRLPRGIYIVNGMKIVK